MTKFFNVFSCICCLWFLLQNSAVAQDETQPLTRDSIRTLIQQSPHFSIYKDNYFITGIPLNEQPDEYNSDVKFQISFKHRITGAKLPFSTYLYLFYTQKSFWNIYRESSPFKENNYHPGVGLGKVIHDKNRVKGTASISFEHESNGRDSIYSRSWNYVGLHYAFIFSERMTLSLTGWVPFGYQESNPELIEYIGLGEAELYWEFIKNKFFYHGIIRIGSRLDGRGSMQHEINFKLTKKPNQYIMLQWFNGYTESLIDYKKYRNMLRIGIVIKPNNIFF